MSISKHSYLLAIVATVVIRPDKKKKKRIQHTLLSAIPWLKQLFQYPSNSKVNNIHNFVTIHYVSNIYNYIYTYIYIYAHVFK